ncbi:MAG: hypothetical protein NTY76_03345 [Candidatus Omnitrophica bacterium]|nr:hypothetical protein [Candidatus Omnitrophota bacterium]
MKKYIGICSLIMLAMLVVSSINPADCFAWRQKYQQELTDNPKLGEANELYKKAIPWIENGDGVHQPQRAAEFYATAESYLESAIFTLKELGNKYAIDVTKEITFCEKLQRETHSKQGDAKRESKLR